MKRILCFLILAMLFLPFFPVHAEMIELYLDGQAVSCDPSPIIKDGRTLIPVRALFEDMGAVVSWNESERAVGLECFGVSVKMIIGDKTAVVNGIAVGLDTPPEIINGRTLIPLRFVSESIGLTVSWDGEKRRVDVFSKKDEGGSSSDDKEDKPVPTSVVSDVSLSEKEGYDVLNFSVSGSYEIKRMTLKNPDREVLDIYGAALSGGNVNLETTTEKVRLGSHDGYVRIVLEGTSPLRYIYGDNNGVVNVKIYSDKKNFNFLGAEEKTLIFPDGAVPTVQNGGKKIIISVSGISLSDEIVKVGDSLVSEIASSSGAVTLSLNRTASARVEGNTVILTENAENTEEDTEYVPTGKRLVVLDAGHGGTDPGSLGKAEDGETVIAYEKDMNLSITLMVKTLLEEQGITVALTRADDTFVGLAERAEFANEKGAELFVSIHNNSIPQPEYKGSMVLFYMTSAKGKVLAKNILDEMVAAAGTIDRGLRDGTNMAVIRRTDMPAVIVECGCLTNSEELANLMDSSFQKKLAEGIAKGIIKTLE